MDGCGGENPACESAAAPAPDFLNNLYRNRKGPPICNSKNDDSR
jgi:hypothetical protein